MTSQFLSYALKWHGSCYTFPCFKGTTTSQLSLLHEVINTSLHPSYLLEATAIMIIHSSVSSHRYGLLLHLFFHLTLSVSSSAVFMLQPILNTKLQLKSKTYEGMKKYPVISNWQYQMLLTLLQKAAMANLTQINTFPFPEWAASSHRSISPKSHTFPYAIHSSAYLPLQPYLHTHIFSSTTSCWACTASCGNEFHRQKKKNVWPFTSDLELAKVISPTSSHSWNIRSRSCSKLVYL